MRKVRQLSKTWVRAHHSKFLRPCMRRGRHLYTPRVYARGLGFLASQWSERLSGAGNTSEARYLNSIQLLNIFCVCGTHPQTLAPMLNSNWCCQPPVKRKSNTCLSNLYAGVRVHVAAVRNPACTARLAGSEVG